MRVVLVPLWLKKALEYAKVDLATVNDFHQLTAILSPEDVAKYVLLNEKREALFSRAFAETFPSTCTLLLCDPPKGSEDRYRKISQIVDYMRAKGVSSFNADEAWLGRDDASNDEYTLTVQSVESDTLIVTPILGQMGESPYVNGETFLDELMTRWVIASGLVNVARSDFFREWLASLGKP